MTHPVSEAPRAEQHRARIFAGLEEVLRTKAFSDLTVADVVAAAGTSKRTFYELYPHKAACLIDHYERASEDRARAVLDAVVAAPDRIAGIRSALEVFYLPMAENPGVARAHLFEVYGLGEDAVRSRQRMRDGFADLLISVTDLDDVVPGVRLDKATALGLVGAISDLAVRAVLEGRSDLTVELDAAVRIVRSVLAGVHREIQVARLVRDPAERVDPVS